MFLALRGREKDAVQSEPPTHICTITAPYYFTTSLRELNTLEEVAQHTLEEVVQTPSRRWYKW